MSDFVGAQLPIQKGDGEAFSAVMQAPPVVRVEIRASQQYFQSTTSQQRQDASDALIALYTGLIQQIVLGQRQNYDVSSIEGWRKLFKFPSVDVEYTMRSGYETILIVTYPEQANPHRLPRTIDIRIGDVLKAQLGGQGAVGSDGSGAGGFYVAWNHAMKGKRKFYWEVKVKTVSLDVAYPLWTTNYGGKPFPDSQSTQTAYTYVDGSIFKAQVPYPRSWGLAPRIGMIWYATQPDSSEPRTYYDSTPPVSAETTGIGFNSTRSMDNPTGVYNDMKTPSPRSVFITPWWSLKGTMTISPSRDSGGNQNPPFQSPAWYGNYSGPYGSGTAYGGVSTQLGSTLGGDGEHLFIIKGRMHSGNFVQGATRDVVGNSVSNIDQLAQTGSWTGDDLMTMQGKDGAQMGGLKAKDVFMFAFDPNTNNLWIGRNGVWVNGGLPAKGQNPTITLDDPGQGAYYPAMQIDNLTFYHIPNGGEEWDWRKAPMDISMVFSPDLLRYVPPVGFEVSKAVTITAPVADVVTDN